MLRKKDELMLTQSLLGSQRPGQELAPGIVLILGIAQAFLVVLGKWFNCCKLVLHLHASHFDT